MTPPLTTWSPDSESKQLTHRECILILVLLAFALISCILVQRAYWTGRAAGIAEAEAAAAQSIPAWPPADIEIQTPELPQSLKEST